MKALTGKRILITGGAGFIGSRLCRSLTERGAVVTAFDSLLEQVHGPDPVVDPNLDLIRGDIRDRAAIEAAVARVRPEIVVHLAAETGTGQSADEPSRYSDVNVVGTAMLIEILRTQPEPPERVVLAATRAVYGEGAYRNAAGQTFIPAPRTTAAMGEGVFELFSGSGEPLTAAPTDESLPPRPGSVYGSTKLMQEYLLQQSPAPWDSVILRLQNVYGPGQSLRNPYTGVLSIFCQQAMSGKRLNIFEDGEIYRDFVFVDDVVAAFVTACETGSGAGGVFNIGSGEKVSIRAAAELILKELGLPQEVDLTGAFRAGDIRHAVADIRLARETLGWTPRMSFATGAAALVAWARAEAS